MTTLNPTVSYNQFVALAGRDGLIFLGLIQAAKRIADWWLRSLLLVLLFVPVVIVAQIVPFYFRKHLSVIFPVLPFLQDRESFLWLKDTFSLYYFALKGYKPFCIFRGPLNALLDELDEHIDSISFVIDNPNLLKQIGKNAESSLQARS